LNGFVVKLAAVSIWEDLGSLALAAAAEALPGGFPSLARPPAF
jgi:hypothetical protein